MRRNFSFTLHQILLNREEEEIRAIRDIRDQQITIERENLLARMYVYHLENEVGKLFSGKILTQ